VKAEGKKTLKDGGGGWYISGLLLWGDQQSGQLPGWLMARIFLREAENLQEFSPRN
jgi:hypothetical protein